MKHVVMTLALLSVLGPCAAWGQSPAPLAVWVMPRPEGIAFDPAGNVYVAEFSPGRINVLRPDGTQIAIWGAYGYDAWSLTGPRGVAVDPLANVYVSEWTINTPSVQTGVQKFTASGGYIASFGSHGVSYPNPPSTFGQPSGLALSPSGLLYVCDTYVAQTLVFNADGTYQTQWPSQGDAIAIDAQGNIFEVEEGGVVRKYSATGVELTHWGSVGSGPGQFQQPLGIAVDQDGNVYVADTYNHRVQVFTSDGVFLAQWGSYGSDPGQFYRPSGIAVGPDGRVYVADTWNGRVQVFGPLTTPAKTHSWGAIKAAFR